MVTEADLDYLGSITIDADLIRRADLVENGAVHVLDVTNGKTRAPCHLRRGGLGRHRHQMALPRVLARRLGDGAGPVVQPGGRLQQGEPLRPATRGLPGRFHSR